MNFSNKLDDLPFVIGHRGVKGLAPENTLISFQKAVDMGVHWVECDIHMSKDGSLLVIHDETVDRTTNGSGFVWDKSLKELKTLDAGEGQKIPTLQELLLWARDYTQLRILIELKHSSSSYPSFVSKVVNLILQTKMLDRVIVISFYHPWLQEIKELNSQVSTGALFLLQPKSAKEMVDAALHVQANVVLPAIQIVDKNLVELVRQKGLGVLTWTVNSFEDLHRALKARVDGIISDSPDWVNLNLKNNKNT